MTTWFAATVLLLAVHDKARHDREPWRLKLIGIVHDEAIRSCVMINTV